VEPRLGTCGDAMALPLLWGLTSGKVRHGFELVPDSLAANGLKFREGSLESSFLSPIDYARSDPSTQIVPKIGVAAAGGALTAAIFFAGGLKDISTLAVDVRFPSEVLLAKIILMEQWGTTPRFVPSDSPLNAVGSRTDAALLVGEAAWKAAGTSDQYIDLLESWEDLTDLPFVHVMVAVKEDALAQEHIDALRASQQLGIKTARNILVDRSGELGISLETLDRVLENYYRFELDEPALESLTEFFRYAYCHGSLTDLPDLKFVEPGKKTASGT